MAIGDFYTQVILIALGAATLLYAMAKKCSDAIDKLEDSLSQEGYVIQSHIWTNDIKDATEEFVSFIQKNISESESEDRYVELFSNKEMISPLKSRLNRLGISYKAYLDFNNLFPNLVNEHEELNKWLIRTITICFAFAGWGAVGFLMETAENLPIIYKNLFWFPFCLLIVLSMILIYKVIYHSRKCGIMKAHIRTEKSKYRDIIGKVI